MDVNPWLLLVCVLLLILAIYRWMSNLYTTLERLGYTGPRPVWVFGNVLEFKDRNVLSVFQEWKAKYGNVYGFYEGFRPGVVINDPDFAKEILVTRFGLFYNRPPYRPFTYKPAEDIVVTNQNFESWKRNKAVLDTALNLTKGMKQIMERLQESSKNMLRKFETARESSDEEIDITEPTRLYGIEVFMRLLLNFDQDQMNEYFKTIDEYTRQCAQSASTENEVAGLARLFPSLTPILKLADSAHRKSHEKVLQLLESYFRRKVNDQNNNKMKADDDATIFSKLLMAKMRTRDIDGSATRRPLVDDEILSHSFLLLSEAFKTTTAMLQFILYELARNPECQERLYEEIIEVCGQDGPINHHDLKGLNYFDMVFNECYRLHPIAPGLTRTVTSDCTIRGYRFEKGMTVRIMTSTMYSDENIFPDPEKFDPERFSAENRSTRNPCTFLPFGIGPRMCNGVKLSILVLKSAIVAILRNYQLQVGRQTQIPLKHAFRPSLSPANSIHIVMTKRK